MSAETPTPQSTPIPLDPARKAEAGVHEQPSHLHDVRGIETFGADVVMSRMGVPKELLEKGNPVIIPDDGKEVDGQAVAATDSGIKVQPEAARAIAPFTVDPGDI